MTKITNITKLFLVACLSIVVQVAMSQGVVMEASTINSDVVSKDIGDPSANIWKVGQWITVGGEISVLNECPSDPAAPKTGAKAMRISVHYPKRTFGGWNASPAQNELPGKPKKISAWVRNSSDPACEPKLDGLGINFVDANTNKFISKKEVSEDYVVNMNNIVNNRANMSKMIVKNNYYNYLFK